MLAQKLTISGPDAVPALLGKVGLSTIELTLFVFLTMVVVDYVNVWTQGRLTTALHRGRGRQYLIASALGVFPGCFGVFLAVTLYLRGMFSFGGLAACFFSTIGDVSFVLLAKDPVTFLRLAAVLFLIGIVFGFFVDRLVAILKIKPDAKCTTEAHHLGEQECRCWPEEGWLSQLRHPLPLRVVYIVFVVLATVVVLTGMLGPQEWNGEKIGVLLLLLISCFVVVTVPDHYLVEHIGHHITRHHLPRVFMWVGGTLLVLALAERFFDLKTIASQHTLWMMGAAVLAGLIPDSGPQLAFVFLFIDGAIPFPVLLANSVAQSGHGLLPLLSVSIRDSILVKFFGICLGLLVGYAALVVGW
jgi:Protein of unknown function (DUF2899).